MQTNIVVVSEDRLTLNGELKALERHAQGKEVIVFSGSNPSLFAKKIAAHFSAAIEECDCFTSADALAVEEDCDCLDDFIESRFGLIVAVVAKDAVQGLAERLSQWGSSRKAHVITM